MGELILYGECVGIWKVVVMACFKISWHS